MNQYRYSVVIMNNELLSQYENRTLISTRRHNARLYLSLFFSRGAIPSDAMPPTCHFAYSTCYTTCAPFTPSVPDLERTNFYAKLIHICMAIDFKYCKIPELLTVLAKEDSSVVLT